MESRLKRAHMWRHGQSRCCQPLAASDGEDILKYFLISRPKATRLQARPL
jgi:hypothetical protein